MGDCNGVATRMESEIVLQRSQNPDIENQGDRQLYQSLVGSLMDLITATRPDLAYTVSMLGVFYTVTYGNRLDLCLRWFVNGVVLSKKARMNKVWRRK